MRVHKHIQCKHCGSFETSKHGNYIECDTCGAVSEKKLNEEHTEKVKKLAKVLSLLGVMIIFAG